MARNTTTVRIEGAVLPPDLLQRVAAGDPTLPGMLPEDYHLVTGERFNEVIARAWNRVLGIWTAFRPILDAPPAGESLTTLTRERWLLPLFDVLGYGRLQTARAIDIDGTSYAISHAWGSAPIHLVAASIDLDRKTAGVAGAARMSPHGMLQELLNRSDDRLWGFVSNGLRLRVLRDSARLTRQAFVEFDLQEMMNGEVYADFVLLWMLVHQSRIEGERPEDCWLERWSREAIQQGTRALDHLRGGVERAIATLGAGFLDHPANSALRESLRSGALDKQDYYRQLLRTVYRLLFLFVAEDREVLLDPQYGEAARERYSTWYSTERLRRLAQRRRGTRHADLWQGLRLVIERLGSDSGEPGLALPALGSGLWAQASTPAINGCELSNRDLLDAVRALAYIEEGNARRVVDYRNLGAEELGSVYESLLELHPRVDIDASTFSLATAGGNERKTTGSYYTPSSLIAELLDSALDPVIEDRLRGAGPDAAAREAALLNLKVVDPAAGSGHFLVAAAHRIAKRLAAVRTGEDEPSPEETRAALRDVIGRCIYGVDINPMAVELCKVSLWLEAMEPGKPLSFLDHHIQCGNSLLGATPALLADGIPDAAFTAITGDDKKYVSEWKKRNKQERKGQLTFDRAVVTAPWQRLGDFAAAMQSIDRVDGDTVEGVRRKQQLWEESLRSSGYAFSKLWADAWCAAFVWKKTKEWSHPLTEAEFRRIERNPHDLHPDWRAEIERLAEQYQFFHWHLAYPDVFRVPGPNEDPDSEQAGWIGGFDVVLGNPPWERIKLQEKEWFAERRPDIANAPNAAARKRMITALEAGDPPLYNAFQDALRQAEGESHLVRTTGRYPLTGRGDVNTYALFAESNRTILSPTGRFGCIVPTGIATDATTQYFFRDLMDSGTLASLYDFENRNAIFPNVHRSYKFCLLSISGYARPTTLGADFVFFAQATEDLRDDWRHFTLSSTDIALLNPNTRTCPIFRSKRDAELNKRIYSNIPVLMNDTVATGNQWGIYYLRLLDYSDHADELYVNEASCPSRSPVDTSKTLLDVMEPVYEAKLVNIYNHRYASYSLRDLGGDEVIVSSVLQLSNPCYQIASRYLARRLFFESVMAKYDYRQMWLFGFREVTNATNERTMIVSVIPRVPATRRFTTVGIGEWELSASLSANLSSMILDYTLRQKMGTVTLSFFTFKQLPVLSPRTYSAESNWHSTLSLRDWLLPRVLELTYTAWDLEPFARDCGYDGPPFCWDEERRFLLRCELDAAYFHLYGIERDDVDYIMETFPIVKRKDEAAHGEYRTKRVILEIYDEMAEATRTGIPYQTRLDPPPADPRVAHDAATRPAWLDAGALRPT